MTIGERIKNRREELGLTQDELAHKCGYKSRSSINKIELSRDLPLRKVSLMAKALETTPGHLMGWEEKTAAGAGTIAAKVAKDKDLQELISDYISLPKEKQEAVRGMIKAMK
jgi:transcriptional regulator with XRE-family HTH domain